jgi:flagellar hook-associated protein 2
MPTIQTSTGLITGLPIADIVDQLMSVAAKPRDRLTARTDALKSEQVAISELMALSIGTQLAATKLSNSSVFQQRTATSSNVNVLSGTVTGDAVPGTYQFTPVRMAQNHQIVSGGVASLDAAVGAGTLRLRFGGFVDKGMDLSLLNGGAGVERGQIKITDRSGTSEFIDLRSAVTIDDVVKAINSADEIDVQAEVAGDSIRLTDQTGMTTTNLIVREVNGGQTAADLGLGDINVAANAATGHDLVRMFGDLQVSQLNDGTGLSIPDELTDLTVTFRDGSAALQIDLDAADIETVDDLVSALNAADPTRLNAAIGPDGKRLVLTDLTTDSGGTFSVASAVGGTLAEDLGLTTTAAGGTLTGARIFGGLQGPLLGSLQGGSGLGTLGQISLTDRSGANAVVNLATAETLDQVVEAINAASVGIEASVNDARNGLVLRDTTGFTTGNLIVANADATNSADRLGVAVNAAESRVDSGSLHVQTFHEGLELSSLNNGKGVQLGSIMLTDSLGATSGVNLRTSNVKTVGDVLDLINGLGLALEARVNDTGDGIMLVDTGHGAATMEVRESGSGTTAADLGILGQATSVDIEGTPTLVIDGATTTELAIDADDTLEDVAQKINDLNLGITANIVRSGTGSTPYRLSLTSNLAGAAGEMMVDASDWNLDFHQITAAQDALLQVGASDIPGAGILATSSTNQFTDIVGGVKLTLTGVSDTPVTITVASTDQTLVSNVKLFVDQFNKLRDKIDDLTYFDSESETSGIMMGSAATLQVETRMSRMMTSRFFGVGNLQSLEQVGLSFSEDGHLEFAELKLKDAFAAAPEAVQAFFTTDDLGFADKFNAVVETLAGEENSVLMLRNETLQKQIDNNYNRIEFFNSRLEKEEERLLTYYYKLELAISKIKSNMSVVEQLASLATTSMNSTK